MRRLLKARTVDIQPDAIYRPEEAAVRFGVPYQRLCEAIRGGDLAYSMVERGKRVKGRDLKAWIDQVNERDID